MALFIYVSKCYYKCFDIIIDPLSICDFGNMAINGLRLRQYELQWEKHGHTASKNYLY